ncbi:hypothetical protein GCM10010193_31610 [Kitasatospora atroaurantiaca]|uniref:Uncharacterized protein n=1 Tax=Kitasatospora atroaurantiaca TaxID=285545 RepID=A0A561ERB3_9ACTN|nr:hypothetical protein FB465_3196 [Kitasatospora atroaurantiaca]
MLGFLLGLVLTVTGVITSTAITRHHAEEVESGQLVSEIRSLIGDNGLFIRPGLSADGGPSWQASAYGLGVARAAGHPRPLPNPDILAGSLAEAIADDPIWGRWYGVQVENSTGTRIPGAWAADVLENLRLPDDPSIRIATIAALADIVSAKSVPRTARDTATLTAQLASAVPQVHSPYSRCRALDAAEELGIDSSGWDMAPAPTGFGKPGDAEALMDAYGTLCVAVHQHRAVSPQLQQEVRRWLAPQLDFDPAGFELQAYYAARGWILAGGSPEQLHPLEGSLSRRADGTSGLLRERVRRLGTLENTYYAARLAPAAFPRLAGARTTQAIHDMLPTTREHNDTAGLLTSAVVLRIAGRPDEGLESEATGLALRELARGVDPRTAPLAGHLVELLEELGVPIPRLEIRTTSPHDREGRYLAWTALAMAGFSADPGGLRSASAQSVVDARRAVADPGALSVKEVAAAQRVLGDGRGGGPASEALRSWTGALQGCSGFRALYRPASTESACTLEATWEILSTGLAAPDSRKITS